FDFKMTAIKCDCTSLDHLMRVSTVVGDSPDTEVFNTYKPTDAITNTSQILEATKQDKYKCLICEAVAFGKQQEGCPDEQVVDAVDYLTVLMGSKILDSVPGRISTEIDARLAFDTEKSVEKAVKLVDMYCAQGIDKERVLIQVPATWEGIKAAQILESEHCINCNLTLVFSLVQAVACAEAGATMISASVGRILDWHMGGSKCKKFEPDQDPGVIAVTNMYNYYKKFDYQTLVMGACFKNVDQIKSLAGCDLLSISPDLLKELEEEKVKIKRRLSPEEAKNLEMEKLEELDESKFRSMINDDAMATDKLSEGIRNSARDQVQLVEKIRCRMC
ncbi:hypothetical protein KR222_011827, partial [Zaprionus bogoriensis]